MAADTSVEGKTVYCRYLKSQRERKRERERERRDVQKEQALKFVFACICFNRYTQTHTSAI